MPVTPEGKVKQAVKKYLTVIGAYYYMPMSNGMGRVGAPDFLVCWKGKYIGIETKAPGKRNNTTPNQDRELAAIRAAGGVAIVIDDVSQLTEVFKEMLQ
jgi:hypothetical protein